MKKHSHSTISAYKKLILSLSFCSALGAHTALQAQTITRVQSLSFGTFALLDFVNVETVQVNSDGSFSSTPDILFITDPQRAIYTISGADPSTTYTVTVPSGSFTIPGNPGKTVTIDNIAAGPVTKITDGSGNATFWLYGDMETTGGTTYADQTLSGDFEVTVTFD